MTSRLDRVNINRALAKCIAYVDCGQPEKAKAWAVQLMRELQARDIVRQEWLASRTEVHFTVHNDTPAWITTEPRTRYFVMADGHIIRDRAGCFRMFKTRIQAERLAAKLNHA